MGWTLADIAALDAADYTVLIEWINTSTSSGGDSIDMDAVLRAKKAGERGE